MPKTNKNDIDIYQTLAEIKTDIQWIKSSLEKYNSENESVENRLSKCELSMENIKLKIGTVIAVITAGVTLLINYIMSVFGSK